MTVLDRWGHGAKSVHGVQKGFVFPCCGKRVKAYDYLLCYADGTERCADCGRAFIEGLEQTRLAL